MLQRFGVSKNSNFKKNPDQPVSQSTPKTGERSPASVQAKAKELGMIAFKKKGPKVHQGPEISR